MKILFQILVALLLLGGLAACTQNDEVIGKRFGMWRVTEITVDGEPKADYNRNMFWSFQAKVIQMKLVSDNDYISNLAECFGGCTKDGNKLILDFCNTDSQNPEPGAAKYSPLKESMLPANSVISLDIVSASSKHMVLLYNAEDGKTIVYKLEKWD